MDRPLLTGLLQDELADRLAGWGEPRYRCGQVLDWVYRQRAGEFSEMSNLPAELRARLAEEFDLGLPELVRVQGAADTTRKFLFRLRDGRMVETVLIPASVAADGERSGRRTLCVSSQVGCAYGCTFCASGLAGFARNLEAGEIVGQVLAVEREAGAGVNNVVFMGMGEPLANLPHLLRSIEILNAPWGAGIGARRITVSTSGLAPQIRELAEHPVAVRLAVSLHGATDAVREQIMPVNKKYPLDELFDALQHWRAHRKQKVTFEYILIDGVNASPADAAELARRAAELGAKVNLIPYNTVEGLDWERPSEADQDAFLAVLEKAGIPATIRREKGGDIDAACGQLRLREEGAMG